MGFLTTITIYNDSISELIENPKDLAEQLETACCGGTGRNGLILQKPRHSNDKTLYMHAGNTVLDVYDINSDWALDEFISEMTYHLARLKQIKKDKHGR